MKFIKCNKKLPEAGKSVLWKFKEGEPGYENSDSGLFIGYIDDNEWVSTDLGCVGCDFRITDFESWAELPEVDNENE